MTKYPIRISLVTEDFVQKQNRLEYSLCICFLVTPSRRKTSLSRKKTDVRCGDR
jgi:hypothetical protein